MTPIEQYLKAFLRPSRVRVDTPTYTKYRYFILIRLQPRYAGKFPHQRVLEQYRPHVDYIILPTNQLLIGFTDDYIDLTKAALELSMKHLLDKQRAVLTAQHHLLNIGRIYKSPIPYAEQFPEQFI